MKTLAIVDSKGKAAGKFSLDQEFFDGRIKRSLVHQVILMHLANKRLGCADTKVRKEVRGGGRKPWRQKGTGRARTGSIRNPVWRGGGVIFGPHPRDFAYSLPKQAKSLALRISLNSKLKDNQLVVLDKIALSGPKTSAFAALLKALKIKDKTLVVIEKHNANIARAAGNIPGVEVKAFNNINAYDVLRHRKVIFSKLALENLIKLRKQ